MTLVSIRVLQDGHFRNGFASSHSEHTQSCQQLKNKFLGSLERHTTHLSVLNGLLTTTKWSSISSSSDSSFTSDSSSISDSSSNSSS